MPNKFPLTAINLQHLERLLTEYGLWQHTRYGEPAEEHGFSIDDQARGLIVGAWLKTLQQAGNQWIHVPASDLSDRLIEACLQFIERAQLPSGKYHNFSDAQGEWLDKEGSEDSFGRTVWGLRTLARMLPDTDFSARAQTLLAKSDPHIPRVLSPRACAFLILEEENPSHLRALGRRLSDLYRQTREPDWRWYETYLTYENPRLPQAMMMAGMRLQSAEWLDMGRESLSFLLEATYTRVGYFSAIGSDGWYSKHKSPARYDQQPVDAGATVEVCLDAWRIFDDKRYLQQAQVALEWYHGNNIAQTPLYDPLSGLVYDGITPLGVNLNRGAESILSYLMARLKWEAITR